MLATHFLMLAVSSEMLIFKKLNKIKNRPRIQISNLFAKKEARPKTKSAVLR